MSVPCSTSSARWRSRRIRCATPNNRGDARPTRSSKAAASPRAARSTSVCCITTSMSRQLRGSFDLRDGNRRNARNGGSRHTSRHRHGHSHLSSRPARHASHHRRRHHRRRVRGRGLHARRRDTVALAERDLGRRSHLGRNRAGPNLFGDAVGPARRRGANSNGPIQPFDPRARSTRQFVHRCRRRQGAAGLSVTRPSC